jgi:hypothetical protein
LFGLTRPFTVAVVFSTLVAGAVVIVGTAVCDVMNVRSLPRDVPILFVATMR